MKIKEAKYYDAKNIIKDKYITVLENDLFYGYYLQDKIVGVIAINKMSFNKVKVKSFYVIEGFRKMGIGNQLLKHVLDLNKNKTIESNALPPSVNLFIKHDFKMIKKYKNGVILMRRDVEK